MGIHPTGLGISPPRDSLPVPYGAGINLGTVVAMLQGHDLPRPIRERGSTPVLQPCRCGLGKLSPRPLGSGDQPRPPEAVSESSRLPPSHQGAGINPIGRQRRLAQEASPRPLGSGDQPIAGRVVLQQHFRFPPSPRERGSTPASHRIGSSARTSPRPLGSGDQPYSMPSTDGWNQTSPVP